MVEVEDSEKVKGEKVNIVKYRPVVPSVPNWRVICRERKSTKSRGRWSGELKA